MNKFICYIVSFASVVMTGPLFIIKSARFEEVNDLAIDFTFDSNLLVEVQTIF
jgi:hypothetical protein